MAARGRGSFSFYIYIENLKKSSCQKPLDGFQYDRNVSLMTLYHDCSSRHDLSKNIAARDGAYFLCIYRKLEEIFLSETTGLISI